MAWHDMAKPNHYQQYLSYSYGPTGKNLGPSPGKPRDASKSMRCWWRLEKGLEERARLTGRDMAPSPKPFLKESPRKRQIPIAGPSFGPWQISSSKNSFLVQTFKPLSSAAHVTKQNISCWVISNIQTSWKKMHRYSNSKCQTNRKDLPEKGE